MPFSHVLLALLVMIVWGANFIFVKFGLDEISPLFLCALRFFFASVPAIFFIKPPSGQFKIIATYGLVTFALQFAFVFWGMNAGMTPGMASLIIQVQVFFSMFFAVLFLGERINLGQILGALISFMGIGVVAFYFDSSVTLLGFLCIIAAAAAWGVGNLISKKIKSAHFMAVIVWGSFIACLPMFLLALVFEGPDRLLYTYDHLTVKGIGSLVYIVYVSTWVGYGVWNWLISHHPVGVIVPFTLLVPVVGIITSVLVLGEPFQLWKLAAGLLVITGLCINLLSSRFFRIKNARKISLAS